jgi:hypothetical protein
MRIVLVRPGRLFADIHMLIEVGIHAPARNRSAECQLMQKRRARGHHHAVQILLHDVVADHVLAGIGAHKGVHLGQRNPRNQPHRLRHALHIHHIGDVSAAAANVHADSRQGELPVVLVRSFHMELRGAGLPLRRVHLLLHVSLFIASRLAALQFRLLCAVLFAVIVFITHCFPRRSRCWDLPSPMLHSSNR